MFLGIDCGGSATRWRLIDGAGAAVASGTAAPASGHLHDAAMRQEAHAVFTALAPAVLAHGRPARVVAGVTGLGNGSTEAASIATWLAAGFGLTTDRVAVFDDIWIAFHTVFRPGTGLMVYAGTGSVACHVDAAGGLHKAGGHGHIIDDGGSAYWIGRAGLHWLVRQQERTVAPPDTKLAVALFEATGGPDREAIRSCVYADPRRRVSGLARAVAGASQAGDAVARRILRQAGQELARLANSLGRRFARQPVALTGGVTRLDPLIGAAFAAALDPACIATTPDGKPDCRPVVTEPVAAAARLAFAAG